MWTTPSSTPSRPSAEREREIVAALRRIIRAVDLHSRRLVEEHGLTGPQLAVLNEIEAADPATPAALASRVHLSRGTVTGILTRLEARGLIARTRSVADRRSVRIDLTELGEQVLSRAPSLLQDRFRRELSHLEEWEQLQVLSTLHRIASMMDASDLDASPHLVTRAEELAQAAPVISPVDLDPDAAGPAVARAERPARPTPPPARRTNHPEETK